MKNQALHNTIAWNVQNTTRQILRYDHTGRVKFINGDAKPSKSQPIQLKNPSLRLGWVGTIDALWQLPPKVSCRNDNEVLFLVHTTLRHLVDPSHQVDFPSLMTTLIDKLLAKKYSCGRIHADHGGMSYCNRAP